MFQGYSRLESGVTDALWVSENRTHVDGWIDIPLNQKGCVGGGRLCDSVG